MTNQFQYEHLQTNGVRLHVVSAGPEEAPLLVFLHGFPEFWYGWRKQIEYFSNAGYRVLAPDQRGYNLSDKPKGVAAYNLEELAADIVGLIDAAGKEKAIVVGHDWGGAVAWWMGVKYPQRLRRLCILNAPHPVVMRRHLMTNSVQRRKSWYFFFFQIPWLPEWRMRRNDWEIGKIALQKTSRRGTFTDEEIEKYCKAWSQPKAVTGMINWYRASMRSRPKKAKSIRVRVPTLMIWGARDRFLGRELVQPSIDLCDDGRLEFIENASHWVQHEEPKRVNQLMYDFFQEELQRASV